MNDKYNFKEIEEKWQKYWEENDSFKTVEDESKKKMVYILFGLGVLLIVIEVIYTLVKII